ncbi:hypothetical protein FHG87_011546 [Trinorchestia longiramus]|nr:hypothetical protein FHG87_011546 [Trinorchestia longiramus]
MGRCSACLYYFHLQCLGPGAHDSCHPPEDALWEWDLLRHLHWSFPSAQPVFLVQNDEAIASPSSSVASIPSSEVSPVTSTRSTENIDVDVSSYLSFDKICVYSSSASTELTRHVSTEEVDATVLTVLDDGPEFRNNPSDPLLYVLPTATARRVEDTSALELPEVTCVTDELGELNLMEIEGMDLDAIMDGLDDAEEQDLYEEQFSEEEVIELVSNACLEPRTSTSPRVRCRMQDDEYLCLGYKKLIEYPATRFELSNFRLLQMVHVELFTASGYPHVKELEAKKLIKYRPRGRRKLIHPKVTASCRCDSDTDSASEGSSDESGDDASDVDWNSVLRIRRHEALEKLRVRLAEREIKLKRAREIENNREKQLKAKTQRSKKERKPLKKNKCVALKRPSVEQDEEQEDDEWEPIPKKKKIKKKIKDEDRTEHVPFSNDDELFFRPPSDEEDIDMFRSTVAGRWRPSNFKELDVWLASRDKLIKEVDSNVHEEDESHLIAKLIESSVRELDNKVSSNVDSEEMSKPNGSLSDSDSDMSSSRVRPVDVREAEVEKKEKLTSLKVLKKNRKKKLDFDRKLNAGRHRLLKKLKRKRIKKNALLDNFGSPARKERLKDKKKSEVKTKWPTLSELSNSIASKREFTSMKKIERKAECKKGMDADCHIAGTPSINDDSAHYFTSPEIVLCSEEERLIFECQKSREVLAPDEDCSDSYILEVLGETETSANEVEVVLHAGFHTDTPKSKRSRSDSNDNIDKELHTYTPKRLKYDDCDESYVAKKPAILEESFDSSIASDLENDHSSSNVINGAQNMISASLPPNTGTQQSTSNNSAIRSSRRVSCGRASQLASMRKAMLDM